MSWTIAIVSAVIHGVVGVVVAGVAVAYRNRMAQAAPIVVGEGVMLRHSAANRYGVIALTIFIVLIVGGFLGGLHDWKETEAWMNVFILIATGLAMVALPTACVLVWRYRVWAGPEGVLIEGVAQLRWLGYEDIARVDETEEAFVLRPTHGRAVRIGKDLPGWAEVLGYIEDRYGMPPG